MDGYRAASALLPGRLRTAAEALPPEERAVCEELRLRQGRAMTALLAGREYPLPAPAAREQVIQKYDPGENDLYVRTLEVAQVKEDEYFSHIAAGDMGVILKDIRKRHEKDTTTADTASPAADAQKQLQEAMSYEGSENEKKARVFLAQLGIDYDGLTKEEFVTLIGILKKSKLLKSPYNQRGRSNSPMTHGKGKRQR